MIFSYNWLKEYVKLPKPEKLVEILTMHSFEVEEVKKAGKDYILDIDVLPNRGPDCFSHIGIAREIAAILRKLNFSNRFPLLAPWELAAPKPHDLKNLFSSRKMQKGIAFVILPE